MQKLKLAIPNKGRLAADIQDLLGQAGLSGSMSKSDRALVSSLGNGVEALFVRAADIPEFVADGAADAGITGWDLVCETGRKLDMLLDLQMGGCRLVAAVPDTSSIVSSKEVENGTRVATSFPNLTKSYFSEMGIDVEVVEVGGATEVTPYLGVADIVVDLTASGSTLRMNRLREVGTVLESSARLISAPERTSAVDELVTALTSVVRARERRYVMANVLRSTLDDVRKVFPGISGPTITDILGHPDRVALHAVVEEKDLDSTLAELKALEAQGILVTRIERLLP